MPQLSTLLLAGFVLFVLWRACQSPWPIKIVAGPDRKLTTQGLPQAKVWRIEEFFERDIRLPGPITVHVRWQPGGRLQTRFSGKLEHGLRQRIRNMLNDVLR